MTDDSHDYENRLRDEPSKHKRQDILIMASNNPEVPFFEYLTLIEIEKKL